MGRRDELLARAEAEVINKYNATLDQMRIDGPVFRYGTSEYPINTISAEVVLGASTEKSRRTATRIIGGGLVAGPGGMLLGGAWRKKADTSQVHITVKLGDGTVHTISKPAKEEQHLRRFADCLESAVNRKWPISTPFGTTLELDPASKRTNRFDPAVAGYMAAAVLSILLLFVIKWWALLLGLVVIVVIAVVDDRYTKAYERELDEHFPGWRGQSEAAKLADQQRMWEKARDDAQRRDTTRGRDGEQK